MNDPDAKLTRQELGKWSDTRLMRAVLAAFPAIPVRTEALLTIEDAALISYTLEAVILSGGTWQVIGFPDPAGDLTYTALMGRGEKVYTVVERYPLRAVLIVALCYRYDLETDPSDHVDIPRESVV